VSARIRIAAAAAVAALAGGIALGSGGGASGASGPRPIERVTVANGNLSLPALIARPSGHKRFPAVVLLHGCSGLWSTGDATQPQRHIRRWLESLQAKGYVAIAVDSFRPRGTKTCGSRAKPSDRQTDAFAALNYLRSLSYVSPQRIGVLGWSTGGSAALATVASKVDGFRAAVAFDPACSRAYRPAVPARVLSAARDPRASGCKKRARRAGTRFKLSVYQGARPGFDEINFHSAHDKAARKRGDAAALKTLTTALSSQVDRPTIFDPDSWITAPLTPSAQLDPDQSAAAALRQQVERFGTWVNTTEWSSPVYVVPVDQPRVKVHIDTAHTRYGPRDIGYMAADFESVPLPPGAEASGPPDGPLSGWIDHELIVYQPATDTAWEFYHLVRDSNGQWSATGGGRITGVSHSDGDYDPWPSRTPHGMTGSGIPMLAGLQRIDELQRATIDHVVGVSIPHVQANVFRSPATRTDGEWTTLDAVPEGTRFRLPADLNVDALPLTPYAKTVAKAIQAHGLVVVDRDCRPSDRKKCPAVTFKAEDPRPRKPDPYAAIFGGVAPNRLLDNFPWDELQVLTED
jgi:dienelactone hydrolase